MQRNKEIIQKRGKNTKEKQRQKKKSRKGGGEEEKPHRHPSRNIYISGQPVTRFSSEDLTGRYRHVCTEYTHRNRHTSTSTHTQTNKQVTKTKTKNI